MWIGFFCSTITTRDKYGLSNWMRTNYAAQFKIKMNIFFTQASTLIDDWYIIIVFIDNNDTIHFENK